MDYIIHNGKGRAVIDGGEGGDKIYRRRGGRPDPRRRWRRRHRRSRRHRPDVRRCRQRPDPLGLCDLVLGTVDGGAGTDILEIVGTEGRGRLLLSPRWAAAASRSPTSQGRRRGRFHHRRLHRGPAPGRPRRRRHHHLDYMAELGPGLRGAESGGKNVVQYRHRNGHDPESGQPIEQTKVQPSRMTARRHHHHPGRDDATGDSSRCTTIPQKGIAGIGLAFAAAGVPHIVVADSVRAEGDTLIVSTRGATIRSTPARSPPTAPR
jgi:hypothetical protein